MTEPIEPLNIFDTDYADIVFNSDNSSFERGRQRLSPQSLAKQDDGATRRPNSFRHAQVSFELQLVKQGIDKAEARTKTRFITLLQKKPETVKELEKLVNAWEEACGYRPDSSHLEAMPTASFAIAKLLWSEEENETD